jgi:hypothetical protein
MSAHGACWSYECTRSLLVADSRVRPQSVLVADAKPGWYGGRSDTVARPHVAEAPRRAPGLTEADPDLRGLSIAR